MVLPTKPRTATFKKFGSGRKTPYYLNPHQSRAGTAATVVKQIDQVLARVDVADELVNWRVLGSVGHNKPSQSVARDVNRKEKKPENEHDDKTGATMWEWVIKMEDDIYKISPYDHGGHSIFKIPGSLLRLEPAAFTPQIVSIGPYHRGKPHLQEMEEHKWRLLRHVLKRTGLPLEVLAMAMSRLEKDVRNCYEKPRKNIGSREFVEMMLLDSCFVLELFNASVNAFENCDPLFSSRGISPFIQRDLLMLENQIPLIVLDRMFALVWDQTTEYDSVAERARNFFSSAITDLYGGRPQQPPPQHLLDIVRQSLYPSSAPAPAEPLSPREKQRTQIVMRSVTKLRGTGIEFVKKNTENILDIEFKNGKLYIPPLTIHDSTKSIFLNLMAFEQSYPQCSNYVTSYVSFMDGLINSHKDVEHLQDKGIIEHGFGSEEEVADLFNNLRKEIVFDTNDYYLCEVSRQLNEQFNRKWRGWKATLKHEYLKDPWKIISLVAASLLIFLTLAQTTYTILGYHRPNQI